MGRVARFVARRLLVGALTIVAISIVSFAIIQLPPGDFATTYIAQLSQAGAAGSAEDAQRLREDLGLDKPLYIRYVYWATDALQGNFGRSLDWGRPVSDLIGERMGLTLVVSVGALVMAWVFAFPIGVYCGMRRGTFGDYVASILGMLGIAVPNFLVALGALFVAFRYFNVDLGELHSPRFVGAPPSFAKSLDMAAHLILPGLIVALASTARLIRILRANLLDELGKPYVVTARAKGMREIPLVLKYPTRIALNPFISTIGLTLPQLISGSVIISLVMNVPTLGPLLLRALQAQDLFLASAIMLVLASLTVVGTLVSDVLLAWLDPRIRMEA